MYNCSENDLFFQNEAHKEVRRKPPVHGTHLRFRLSPVLTSIIQCTWHRTVITNHQSPVCMSGSTSVASSSSVPTWHGTNDDALKVTYKSVVLAKLLCAFAWRGFTISSYRLTKSGCDCEAKCSTRYVRSWRPRTGGTYCWPRWSWRHPVKICISLHSVHHVLHHILQMTAPDRTSQSCVHS